MKYLIDIDGTLLNGSEVINGAVKFIDELKTNDDTFLLMTNSIKNKSIQVKRLHAVGIDISEEKILNPIVVINEYLFENKIQNVKIIGSKLEIEQIKSNNVIENYECVLLLDFEKSNFGYNVIQELVYDVENGKTLITASLSTYYLNNGHKTVDTGAFVKMIEDITGTRIENYGKPSMKYFGIAAKLINETNENICVIGDDWKTDIIGAKEFGAKSILVKTGKYENGDELKASPYRVVNSLEEI